MARKSFWLLLLLAAFTAAAQDSPSPFALSVEQALLVKFETGAAAVLVQGSWTNGCDLPTIVTQSTDADGIRVSINQDQTADGVCQNTMPPFETQLKLEWDFEAKPLLLDINDTTWRIDPPDRAASTPARLSRLLRLPISIDRVHLLADGDPLRLRVQGGHATGCDVPTRIYRQPTATGLEVQIYDLHPDDPAFICPMMLRLYDETIAIEMPEFPYTHITVNGVPVTHDAEGAMLPETIHMPIVVETVTPMIQASFPPQVSLEVQGYIQDGCAIPVEITQRSGDGEIDIELYRRLPPDVMCPMNIVPYENSIGLGTLAPGRYTIRVNDIAIELEF